MEGNAPLRICCIKYRDPNCDVYQTTPCPATAPNNARAMYFKLYMDPKALRRGFLTTLPWAYERKQSMQPLNDETVEFLPNSNECTSIIPRVPGKTRTAASSPNHRMQFLQLHSIQKITERDTFTISKIMTQTMRPNVAVV